MIKSRLENSQKIADSLLPDIYGSTGLDVGLRMLSVCCWLPRRRESERRKAETDVLRIELDGAKHTLEDAKGRVGALERELRQTEARLRSAEAQKASVHAEVVPFASHQDLLYRNTCHISP